MNDYLIAVVHGVIEGLTEFLPVSSTGHLILAEGLFGTDADKWKSFDVMIQLGAILAVIVLYFQKLWSTVIRLPSDPKARYFALSVLVAFLPAAVLGALFGKRIEALLFNPLTVGIMLILGGLVILLVENMVHNPVQHDAETVPLKKAGLIGLAQAVSMIPGTSRSAATIIGGLALGLDRKAAAEFSFFLAIPTMVAAFGYKAFQMRLDMDFSSLGVLAVGFIVSFIAALLVIKPFLGFVSKYGFAPFAYYRVFLGALVLVLLYLGR